MFLTVGFLSLTFIAPPTVNYFWYGKPSKRGNLDAMDSQVYRRDNRLDPTGRMDGNFSVYWEGIPDAPDK